MSVVAGWVGATPPPQTAPHVNQPLWCHLVTATQQTRDIDTMLAQWASIGLPVKWP